jgi:hypothetical protein
VCDLGTSRTRRLKFLKGCKRRIEEEEEEEDVLSLSIRKKLRKRLLSVKKGFALSPTS